MADGKWVSGLTAEMELVEAARRVLEVRLRVVGEYLPRVERADPTDTENVHQLRVATRRAGAALRIFKVCLPHKVARRAGQRLRRIRRAAGRGRATGTSSGWTWWSGATGSRPSSSGPSTS